MGSREGVVLVSPAEHQELVVRKPFFLDRLKKAAAWIGEKLLEANLLLIKLAFGGQSKKTQTT